MARQNGQLTFQTPGVTGALGDDASSTSTFRTFTATERCTVVEVGAVNLAVSFGTSFAFRALYRTGGVTTNDTVIPVWTAGFAAQGGIGGDPSVLNFDNANQIASGVITNTAGDCTVGGVLRAYCEQTLNKGDQIVFDVTGAGAGSSLAVFYAKTYCDGAGIVEANDVDSN